MNIIAFINAIVVSQSRAQDAARGDTWHLFRFDDRLPSCDLVSGVSCEAGNTSSPRWGYRWRSLASSLVFLDVRLDIHGVMLDLRFV